MEVIHLLGCGVVGEGRGRVRETSWKSEGSQRAPSC